MSKVDEDRKKAELEKIEILAYEKRQQDFIDNPTPLPIVNLTQGDIVIPTPFVPKYTKGGLILMNRMQNDKLTEAILARPHTVVAFDKDNEDVIKTGVRLMDKVMIRLTSSPKGFIAYDEIKYSIFNIYDVLFYIKDENFNEYVKHITSVVEDN